MRVHLYLTLGRVGFHNVNIKTIIFVDFTIFQKLMRTNVFKNNYCNYDWIVKLSNVHQSEHDEQ